ncbi:uncharacterized protein LOC144880999 [Branchiostoma floridae x Branchiostoma japonicum]
MSVSLAVALLACTLAVLVLPTAGYFDDEDWGNTETWSDYADYPSEQLPLYSAKSHSQHRHGTHNKHVGKSRTGKHRATITSSPVRKTDDKEPRQRNILLDRLRSSSFGMKSRHQDETEDYQLGLDVAPVHKKSPLSPGYRKDALSQRKMTSKLDAFKAPSATLKPKFNNASESGQILAKQQGSTSNDCAVTVIYASSLTFLVTVAMVILLYLILVLTFKRRRFKPHDWWMAGQGSDHGGDDDVMNDRASNLSLLKPFFHLASEDEVFHIGGTPRSGTTSSSEEDSLMRSLNKKNKKMKAPTRKEFCERDTKEQQDLRESRTERWVESVSQLNQDPSTQS